MSSAIIISKATPKSAHASTPPPGRTVSGNNLIDNGVTYNQGQLHFGGSCYDTVRASNNYYSDFAANAGYPTTYNSFGGVDDSPASTPFTFMANAPAPPLLLDDFEAAGIYETNPGEPNPQSRYLWSQYDGSSDPGSEQLSSAAAHDGSQSLEITVDGGNAYAQYRPAVGPHIYFMHELIQAPWTLDTYNRMRFWVKVPPDLPVANPGQSNMTVGTHVRAQAGDPYSFGGIMHHFFNIPYSGEWHQIIVDTHPNGWSGLPGSTEPGDQPYPTGEAGFNFFDAVTRFYIDFAGSFASYPVPFYLDGFELYQETQPENIDQVYSLNGVYVPSSNTIRVGWMRDKDENSVNHEVRYAFQDIHQLGWVNATPAPNGTVTPPGWQGYNGMEWSTTAIDVSAYNKIYVAIKPTNATLFRQIVIPVASPDVNDLVTHYDNIPNFGQNPTVTVKTRAELVQLGKDPDNVLWSDPDIWQDDTPDPNDNMPEATDIVRVPSGVTVVYDLNSANSNASLRSVDTIGVAGHLKFKTDLNTELKVANLLVYPEGVLEIGSVQAPIQDSVAVDLTLADKPLDTANDPEQFGSGLIVLGKAYMHGRTLTPTFVRLAQEALANDAMLQLEGAVSGWAVGDQLALPDTHQLESSETGGNYVYRNETATIAGISADGKTLTLSAPLQYDHYGARDLDGNLLYLPHVMNLSRNITLHAEDPAGTRGHTMFLDRADIDIRYVQFRDLGRTTTAPLDNTTFDGAGNVTHIGTNQSGRYPLYARYLIGPTTPQANGYQFTLLGNSVIGGSSDHPYKWSVTLHGSHYGLVAHNTIYNAAGAGLVTADGSESGNVIDHNMVMWVTGTGNWQETDAGTNGSAFWFRGFNNHVRNNVAATVKDSAVYHDGYKFNGYDLGPVTLPAAQGDDPLSSGVVVDMNAQPMLEFDNNEAYGVPNGLSIWWHGASGSTPLATQPSTVSNIRIWHFHRRGYDGSPTAMLTIDGFAAIGDRFHTSTLSNTAMSFDEYTKDLTVRHAAIQGAGSGILLPFHSAGETLIEDTVLRNQTNLVKSFMYSVNGSAGLGPALTTIRNVKYDPFEGQPLRAIEMVYTEPWRGPNYMQKDEVDVEAYDQVPGDDFRVYYLQQAPTFVVPETGSNGDPLIGAPPGDVGLSNQDLVSLYPGGTTIQGQFYNPVAMGGAICPTTETRPGIINGYVETLP